MLVWARHEALWSFLFKFFFSLCIGATSFTVVMTKDIFPSKNQVISQEYKHKTTFYEPVSAFHLSI